MVQLKPMYFLQASTQALTGWKRKEDKEGGEENEKGRKGWTMEKGVEE